MERVFLLGDGVVKEFGKGVLYILGHRYVDVPSFVVPLQSETAIEGT